MSKAPTAQELIGMYRETGNPVLALEIQKSISAMTAEQKIALADQLDQGIVEEPIQAAETFESGKPAVEKPSVIEQIEVAPAEVVVPPAVEAADTEILKEVEAVVPEVAEEDKKVEAGIAEAETLEPTSDAVDAAAPIDFQKARERLLSGDQDRITTDECNEGEEAWYKLAA